MDEDVVVAEYPTNYEILYFMKNKYRNSIEDKEKYLDEP